MTPDFEAFWRAYPRRVGKGDAFKAWMQTANIRPPVDDILTAIAAAQRCEQWQKGADFIPYPATWLRRWGWLDEHTVTVKPKLPLVSSAPQRAPQPTQPTLMLELPPPPSAEQIAKAREALGKLRRVA